MFGWAAGFYFLSFISGQSIKEVIHMQHKTADTSYHVEKKKENLVIKLFSLQWTCISEKPHNICFQHIKSFPPQFVLFVRFFRAGC